MKKDKKTTIDTVLPNKKARNDIILIAAFLLVALIATLALFLFRTEGDTVIVTVDGELWGEYSLNEDRIVEIKSGEGYNILVIEDGTAYVQLASCPDGICSSHHPIHHNGASIICLPNKVVIEIRSHDKNQPDIIT